MNKKSILLCLRLPNPVHGESVISQFVVQSELLKQNFNLNYIDIKSSSEITDIEKFKIKKVIKIFNVYITFLKKIIFNKPNLVYVSLSPIGIPFLKDSIIIFLAKLFNIKVLVHMHGRGIQEYRKEHALHNFLYKKVFNNIYCISLSTKLTEDLNSFRIKKQYILNNGISKNTTLNKKLNNNGETSIRLLFLSNLIKQKGIIDFLDACIILKKRGVDFRANIIGKSYDVTADDIDFFAKKNNLENNITYFGPLYGEEKNIHLTQNDILIFPSKNEAFPLVLLEAFQFGLVPISTTIGGIPDIVTNGETGYLVQINNPTAISEMVIKLYNNKALLNSLSVKCKIEYTKKYTLETFEKNLSNIFNDVLQEH